MYWRWRDDYASVSFFFLGWGVGLTGDSILFWVCVSFAGLFGACWYVKDWCHGGQVYREGDEGEEDPMG